MPHEQVRLKKHDQLRPDRRKKKKEESALELLKTVMKAAGDVGFDAKPSQDPADLVSHTHYVRLPEVKGLKDIVVQMDGFRIEVDGDVINLSYNPVEDRWEARSKSGEDQDPAGYLAEAIVSAFERK